MSRFRLLQVVLGLLVLLGALLWLISTLVSLHAGLASVSLGLANLVVGALLVLIVALLGALAYYAVLFLRPRRARRLRQVPIDKAEAAGENLRAVQQQVAQIHDEVAQQAFVERAQAIENYLAQGEIRIVVFGMGSAGKTSLVNAVLGQLAGKVGAAMGTTTEPQQFRFRLPQVERDLWLTDTPGILEAGVVGTVREQQARQLAAEADLLLFLVDSDLRKSEYDPLRSLVEIGKRSVLVLNKADLYPDDEVEAILAHLRQRVQGFIAPVDVVAIAANPQAVRLASGDRFQPDPEILPLLRRMAAILRDEGDDLMADNILLQSQRLGEEARQLLATQRRRQADQVVDRYQWIGAGVVSVTPLPGIDLLAAAAVNAQMVIEIGQIYGCEMNLDRGKELAVSLAKTLVSLGVVRGATELLSLALQTNVGTFLIGRAIQGVTAAYLIRIAGKSFIEYFRRDQTWGDGGISEVVEQQFQLNRRDEFIQRFAQDAVNRVIEPLRSRLEEPSD